MVGHVAVTDLRRRVIDRGLDVGHVEQALGLIQRPRRGALRVDHAGGAHRGDGIRIPRERHRRRRRRRRFSVLADDGATADSDAASATAATIRTLISDPPGLPVKGDAPEATFTRRLSPSGTGCRRSSRRAGPRWPGVRMITTHAGPQERSTGRPTGLRRVPGAPRAWQWSIVSVPSGCGLFAIGKGEGAPTWTIVVIGSSVPGRVAGRRDEGLRRGCRPWQSSLCWGSAGCCGSCEPGQG